MIVAYKPPTLLSPLAMLRRVALVTRNTEPAEVITSQAVCLIYTPPFSELHTSVLCITYSRSLNYIPQLCDLHTAFV